MSCIYVNDYKTQYQKYQQQQKIVVGCDWK